MNKPGPKAITQEALSLDYALRKLTEAREAVLCAKHAAHQSGIQNTESRRSAWEALEGELRDLCVDLEGEL